MTANGQLVFTDVDKVTFKGVGGASNAVIDTTTGKIGVGVDSPDANLHVVGNCFVSTNFELGGTMTMGTVTVRAQHELSAITATGNTTPHTVEFQNATTGFVTTANIEVGTANLFVDTSTSNVGIGTNAPIDTLHINGGTRFAGHIIPTTNATFDIGSAENKVRDLYVDTNSIWVGDRAKIAFENGKMKFKRRKLNKVPRMLVNLAISGGRTDEADVETHAIAFAQTKDPTISTVSDLKLEHLRDYAKTFDNTKAISDIFADNDEDYEAITASEAFMEVGSNIFTEHSLSIGKTTDPTSALDVVGDMTVVSNVNMLHSSNNAAIKLNSNVVAEFPRSKKLMKYPRVALASDNDQGYTVETSNEQSTHKAWEVFDNISTSVNGTFINRWRTNDNRYNNNISTGNPSIPAGSSSEYLFTGSEPGDWITLEIPEKMSLKTFRFSGPNLHTPYEGIIYGYDTVTSSWKYVSRFIYKTPKNIAWRNSDETIVQATSAGYNSTVTYISSGKDEATYSPMYYTDNNLFFSKYAMIINKTNGQHAASLYSWELYGVPEYDPEVHGTDIIMRSVNNIPNTDWLVVYYDGQDYTSVENTITNKTGVTAQNATISNSGSTITFDSDYKAWKFGGDDTRTDTFITTLPSTFVGNQAHSASIWFRMDKFINTGNTGDDALFSISTSGGEGTSNQALGVRFNTTFESGYQLLYYFWDNDVQISFPNNEIPSVKKWYHLVVTYDGEQRLAFIDGQYAPIHSTSGGTYGNLLNLPASAQLQLGRRNNNANEFHGSIANFRLYNRPISEDEIWQLYAYQKEFFNKEPDVVTFKNGRLGVGTTEPRAVLDIRGDILVNGMRLQFLLDGSSPEKAAPSAVHLLNNNMRHSGFYWIRPEGYGTPTQIYCDLDGTVSGIGTGGWMRVEYAADYATQSSPWGNTGNGQNLTASVNSTSTFTFVQSDQLINRMKETATQIRQTFERWGQGSVGWTYNNPNKSYVGIQTHDGSNFWNDTPGTAATYNLPPNTSISFNGWNAQGTLALGKDPTDNNYAGVWDQSIAYFVEDGNTYLPIKKFYATDVDAASELSYFPLKTGYNSYIWIK